MTNGRSSDDVALHRSLDDAGSGAGSQSDNDIIGSASAVGAPSAVTGKPTPRNPGGAGKSIIVPAAIPPSLAGHSPSSRTFVPTVEASAAATSQRVAPPEGPLTID